MKNIIKSRFIAALMLLASSCSESKIEEVRIANSSDIVSPVVSTTSSIDSEIVLSSPSNLYDDDDRYEIALEWSNADFGYDGEIKYAVSASIAGEEEVSVMAAKIGVNSTSVGYRTIQTILSQYGVEANQSVTLNLYATASISTNYYTKSAPLEVKFKSADITPTPSRVTSEDYAVVSTDDYFYGDFLVEATAASFGFNEMIDYQLMILVGDMEPVVVAELSEDNTGMADIEFEIDNYEFNTILKELNGVEGYTTYAKLYVVATNGTKDEDDKEITLESEEEEYYDLEAIPYGLNYRAIYYIAGSHNGWMLSDETTYQPIYNEESYAEGLYYGLQIIADEGGAYECKFRLDDEWYGGSIDNLVTGDAANLTPVSEDGVYFVTLDLGSTPKTASFTLVESLSISIDGTKTALDMNAANNYLWSGKVEIGDGDEYQIIINDDIVYGAYAGQLTYGGGKIPFALDRGEYTATINMQGYPLTASFE